MHHVGLCACLTVTLLCELWQVQHWRLRVWRWQRTGLVRASKDQSPRPSSCWTTRPWSRRSAVLCWWTSTPATGLRTVNVDAMPCTRTISDSLLELPSLTNRMYLVILDIALSSQQARTNLYIVVASCVSPEWLCYWHIINSGAQFTKHLMTVLDYLTIMLTIDLRQTSYLQNILQRLTACTPGSAPGPTLGNEYGKTCPCPLQRTQGFLGTIHLGWDDVHKLANDIHKRTLSTS